MEAVCFYGLKMREMNLFKIHAVSISVCSLHCVMRFFPQASFQASICTLPKIPEINVIRDYFRNQNIWCMKKFFGNKKNGCAKTRNDSFCFFRVLWRQKLKKSLFLQNLSQQSYQDTNVVWERRKNDLCTKRHPYAMLSLFTIIGFAILLIARTVTIKTKYIWLSKSRRYPSLTETISSTILVETIFFAVCEETVQVYKYTFL